VTPFEEADEDFGDQSTSAVARIVAQTHRCNAWLDGLAVIYADRYRSAFVLAFLLAAFAVGMALLPVGLRMYPHQFPETLCILLELLAIIFILILVIMTRSWRWHERWINYRFAAEMVRHLRLVAPLGGGRPFPQIPAHWAVYGQPGSTWMAWYVRAVERALGLPSVVVNKDYLENCLAYLQGCVKEQVDFHNAAAKRCQRIERRLHLFEIVLLVLTLASCGLHLLPGVFHVELPKWLPPLLTFFCGFFPALSAAFAGILNQGEFRRIEMRSQSMKEQLELVGREIVDLRGEIKEAPDPTAQQFSGHAVTLASEAARLLLNEVLDWRVVFLDRPFEQPPT
jgi:hypothetical protein